MNDNTSKIVLIIFWLALAGTLYTYFLYPVILILLNNLRKAIRKNNNTNTNNTFSPAYCPSVTMIISAYNEQDVLPDKIRNCMQIDYPREKLHFIIGSDGSDDRTADILRNIKDDRFTTIINPHRQGKVAMLNMLVELSNSCIIVFSDANTMYASNAVTELVKPFAQPKTGCVIGKLELAADVNDTQTCQPEGLYWRYENRIKQLENKLGILSTINGGIFAIRRHLFEQLPSNTITEDQVLGMKIMTRGYKCVLAQNAHACEEVSNWTGELRRRIRISAGNFQSLFLVPAIMHPRTGWVALSFISHKLLRWMVPLFMAAMLGANILLAGQAFYGSTLILQGSFYASGLLAIWAGKLIPLPKALIIPKYFLAMNGAILIGLYRFLASKQKVTWQKAPRNH